MRYLTRPIQLVEGQSSALQSDAFVNTKVVVIFWKLLPLNKGLKQTKEKSDFYLQPMLVSEKNALLNSTIKSKFTPNTAQYIVVNSADKCCFIQYEVILFAFSSL